MSHEEMIRHLAWYIAELCAWAKGADCHMSDLSDRISAVNTKLDKVAAEEAGLVSKVADLTAALDAAGVTDPDVLAAVDALEQKATTLDDLVPDAAPPADAPVDPPAEAPAS